MSSMQPLKTDYIEENAEFVAVPITPASLAEPLLDQSDIEYDADPERNDRYAGLKHACICILMLGLLPYLIYLFWHIHIV